MNNRTLSLVVKISIVLIALAGLAVCAYWYPFSISLTAIGLPSGERVPANSAERVAFWTQLIFYWVASLPCFAVLFLGWCISNAVKRDEVFSTSTVKKLNLACYILFAASCVFLVGNIVFTVLQWNVFAIGYYAVGVLGILLSFMISVIARYVSKAQILKEENDSYL